jgi:hypothetical protein
LIETEEKRVDHAHRRFARVKIKPDVERQPLALARL